jgi:DNA-binding SARP family transcriptional activator
MGYTALANGRSKIEERFARWLLMEAAVFDQRYLRVLHTHLPHTSADAIVWRRLLG